jgi:hypothetical protein
MNLILFNLYFDSTNLSKNKNKNKNIFEVYLTFCNDSLKSNSNSKKHIYNLLCIEEKKLKNININSILEFLCNKIKNEVQNFYIENILVKSYCLFVIGDNKEIYDLLRLKTNFGTSRWMCRVCDHDKHNLNNINTTLTNNDNYLFGVKAINLNEDNTEFFNNKNEISNLFILKHIDIVKSFPLDIQVKFFF